MKYIKTLAGCIDIWYDSCDYPENTIKFVENICNDPERDKVNWLPAQYMGDDENQRKCDYLNLTALYRNTLNPIMHKVYEDFNLTVTDATGEYMKRYGIRENCYNNSSYQMIRYREGGEYPNHYDGPTETGRHISVIQYLNDDYDGGELIFPLHNIWIKPVAGMLVMFPSSWAYQHMAQPVSNGTKYANVTWLHDRENVNESSN